MYNRGIEMELGIEPDSHEGLHLAYRPECYPVKNQITKMPAENPEIIDGTKKLKEGSSIYDLLAAGIPGCEPGNGRSAVPGRQFRCRQLPHHRKRAIRYDQRQQRPFPLQRHIHSRCHGWYYQYASRTKAYACRPCWCTRWVAKHMMVAYAALMSSGGYGSAKARGYPEPLAEAR